MTELMDALLDKKIPPPADRIVGKHIGQLELQIRALERVLRDIHTFMVQHAPLA